MPQKTLSVLIIFWKRFSICELGLPKPIIPTNLPHFINNFTVTQYISSASVFNFCFKRLGHDYVYQSFKIIMCVPTGTALVCSACINLVQIAHLVRRVFPGMCLSVAQTNLSFQAHFVCCQHWDDGHALILEAPWDKAKCFTHTTQGQKILCLLIPVSEGEEQKIRLSRTSPLYK